MVYHYNPVRWSMLFTTIMDDQETVDNSRFAVCVWSRISVNFAYDLHEHFPDVDVITNMWLHGVTLRGISMGKYIPRKHFDWYLIDILFPKKLRAIMFALCYSKNVLARKFQYIFTNKPKECCFNSAPPNCRKYASVNGVSIGSDNGFSPIRLQAIIWTSAGLLSVGHFGTNFSEILIKL